MKKVLLLLALAGLSWGANAQSIVAVYNETDVAQGDTITVVTNEQEPIVRINFRNTSATTITAQSTCTTVAAPHMSVVAMCAGACQQGNVSPEFDIAGGETYTGFFADFAIDDAAANGDEGLFCLTTSDVNSDADACTVYVRIVYSNAAIDAVDPSLSIQIYPNPAATLATVYATGVTEGSVLVRDLKGSVVAQVPVEHGVATIDVTGLSAGAYLCSVLSQGRLIQTRKLVVR